MLVSFSYKKPFWITDNENKPSKEQFLAWKKHNLIDHDPSSPFYEQYNNINFIDIDNVEIIQNKTMFYGERYIQYLKVVYNENSKVKKEFYYYLDNFKKLAQNRILLSFKIDIWATYTLQVIDELINNDTKLYSYRNHLFKDSNIQYTDELLNVNSFNYQNPTNINIPYSYNDGYYEGNYIRVKDIDKKCNLYYVFNDSPNNEYMFLPELKSFGTAKFSLRNTKPGIKIRDILFMPKTKIWYSGHIIEQHGWENYNGGNHGNIKNYGIDPSNKETFNLDQLDTIIQNAYTNNWVVEWKYKATTQLFRNKEYNIYYWNNYVNTTNNDPTLFNWNVANWTNPLPSEVVANGKVQQKSAVGTEIRTNFIVQGQEQESLNYKGQAAWGDANKNAVFGGIQIWISIYEPQEGTGWKPDETIDNTYENLELLRKSQEYSNKFLGIYYGPNILSFKTFSKYNINNKNYLSLRYTPRQNYIATPNLFSIEINNNWWELNNNVSLNSKLILKNVIFNYYNNLIPLESAIYNNNGIYQYKLNGYLFFNGQFNIIQKYNYRNLQAGIITLPYKLPCLVNDYLNYVNAQKETLNTNYQVSKEQLILNEVKHNINLVGGISTNLLSGNVVGGITGVINNSFNTASTALKFNNQIRQIKAQMKDSNNTLGNTLVESSTKDAMWMYYNYENNIPSETVEITQPTPESLKLMNNVIAKYGEKTVSFETLNTLMNPSGSEISKYAYIELDTEYLLNVLITLNLDFIDQTHLIYVIDQLKAFRIWHETSSGDIEWKYFSEQQYIESRGINEK